MKRDLNLMRQILIDLSDMPYLQNNISHLFPDKTQEEYQRISFHIELLKDLGYIEIGSSLLGYGYNNYYISRITNNGYDFISLTSDEVKWKKHLPTILELGNLSLHIIEKVFNI